MVKTYVLIKDIDTPSYHCSKGEEVNYELGYYTLEANRTNEKLPPMTLRFTQTEVDNKEWFREIEIGITAIGGRKGRYLLASGDNEIIITTAQLEELIPSLRGRKWSDDDMMEAYKDGIQHTERRLKGNLSYDDRAGAWLHSYGIKTGKIKIDEQK